MAIPLDDSILIGQQKATDAKYDNDGQPLGYTSIAQAKSIITIGLRYAGLTIKINGIEYWWPSDETDLTTDPIIKTLPTTIFPDGLISGGNIDISDFSNGNITVAPAQWLLTISGTQSVYQSTTPTLFSGIGLSSSGNQRYVAFFGDANGDIIKVEGAQSPAAVMPSTPANTVPIGHVLITDAVAQPPVVDLSQYALKSEIIYAMLMGLVLANTAIANGDSIVTAFGKIQGQLNAKQNSSDKATVSDINTGTDDAKFLTSLGLQGSKYIDRTFSKISATTSGTSTAYTASLSPALTAYVPSDFNSSLLYIFSTLFTIDESRNFISPVLFQNIPLIVPV